MVIQIMYGEFMGGENAETGVEMSSFEEKPVRVKEVEMLPIDNIRPHEEIDDKEMESFKSSLREKGIFYKPILVAELDEENYMIIDGTHRWAGLKDMGANEIPGIILDYFDESEVKLHAWHPLTETTIDEILDILSNVESSEIINLSRKESLKRINECEFILADKDSTYLVKGNHRNLFMELIENGISFTYVDDKEKALNIVEDEGKTCLIRKTPEKREVLKTVSKGEYMPPKGTRHCLPYKYPHIYFEMGDLI